MIKYRLRMAAPSKPSNRDKLGFRRTITGVSVSLLLAILVLAACSACFSDSQPAGPRPNIVFIVVDALRRDHLSSFGYARPTSPRLDALVADGVLFENMMSAASQTVPATAALLTGLYPSQTGMQYFGKLHSFDGEHHWQEAGPQLDESHTLLAEWLGELGYRTGAAVSNPWLQPQFGFAQGFDDYLFDDCVNLRAPKQDVCDGNDLVERAIAWLEAPDTPDADDPFFLYLHFMDVHAPYSKPGITTEKFVNRRGHDRYVNGLAPNLKKVDLEYMTALYDEGIQHVDGVIGRFWDHLVELDVAEETLLVVTSDHGDEFHEHRGLGHGTTLYEELVESFLLLRYPQKLPAARIPTTIAMVDLMPTIAALLEVPVPADGPGRSVLGLAANPDATRTVSSRAFFSELGELKAIRQADWKLILDVDSGEVQLFNLATDPGEQENLASSEPELAQRLRDDLLRFLAGVATESNDSEHVPLDEETLERLRALGYVQ